MKKLNALTTTALSGVFSLGVLTAGGAAAVEKTPMEKCYGVVKSGKNDCQTATSACAGTSKKDSQKDAWIFLPKGTCEKIAGASIKTGK